MDQYDRKMAKTHMKMKKLKSKYTMESKRSFISNMEFFALKNKQLVKYKEHSASRS